MMNIGDNSVDRFYDFRYDCKLQKYREANCFTNYLKHDIFTWSTITDIEKRQF